MKSDEKTSHIVAPQSPEEIELESKLEELDGLKGSLAENELRYATIISDLGAFERRYFNKVGCLYAALDHLEARFAELRANQVPSDETLQEEARQARVRSEETASGLREHEEDLGEEPPPSKDLKALYLELATIVHPDLTLNADEKERRHEMMVRVNVAYGRRDIAALRKILADWHEAPESVEGVGVAAELVRAIRMITQIVRRAEELDVAIDELLTRPMWVLKIKVEEAEETGRDLLEELAAELRTQTEERRSALP